MLYYNISKNICTLCKYIIISVKIYLNFSQNIFKFLDLDPYCWASCVLYCIGEIGFRVHLLVYSRRMRRDCYILIWFFDSIYFRQRPNVLFKRGINLQLMNPQQFQVLSNLYALLFWRGGVLSDIFAFCPIPALTFHPPSLLDANLWKSSPATTADDEEDVEVFMSVRWLLVGTNFTKFTCSWSIAL